MAVSAAESGFIYSVFPEFHDNIKTVCELKELQPRLLRPTDSDTQTSFAASRHDNSIANSCSGPFAAKNGDNNSVLGCDKEEVNKHGEWGANGKSSAGKEASLHGKSSNPPEYGGTSSFRVDPETLESLLDVTASLQLRDAQGTFSTSQSSVVLISKMRRGHSFMDEVVLHLAKELNSIVLSIGQQDLEDLAEEFYIQEQTALKDGRLPKLDAKDTKPDLDKFDSLSKYYFASRTERKVDSRSFERCMDAFSALFDAIHKKNKRQAEEMDKEAAKQTPKEDIRSAGDGDPRIGEVSEDHTKKDATSQTQLPPILVHFRDGKEVMGDAQYGRRLITRMRDAVNRRRAGGENITFLISVTHGDADEEGITPDQTEPWKVQECRCWLCTCDDVRECSAYRCEMRFSTRKLHLTKAFNVVLIPSAVPEQWPGPRKLGRGSSMVEINISRFKRRLRSQLRHFKTTPPDLLQPSCDWTQFLGRETKASMESKSKWNEKRMGDAVVPIIGRCVRKQSLEASDIEALLSRVLLQEKAEEKESENDKQKEEEEKDEEQSWKQKLKEVERACNSEEEKLLANVVNPSKLDSPLEGVILDEEVINTVKTLIHLSKIRTEGASEALLSQIRIKGAMLYGPPGTGKTHLARAIAKGTGSNMLILNASVVRSKWVGETEKQIHAAFTLAEKLFPCIIFMDEVDSLFYRRGDGDRSWERAAITQFLQEMDGLVQSEKAPFVLVATNRPSDLDSAFIRRLPQKIPFGLPDVRARAAILRLFLKDEDLDGVDIDNLAASTEGYSGSDLKSLCGEAGLIWAVEQQFGVADFTKPKSNERLTDQQDAKDAEIKDQPLESAASMASSSSNSADISDASTVGSVEVDAGENGSSVIRESDGSSCPTTPDTGEQDVCVSDEAPKLKLRLTKGHFVKALKKIQPSVSRQDLNELDRFTQKFSPARRISSNYVSEQSGDSKNVLKPSESDQNDKTTESGCAEEEDDSSSFFEPMPIINPPNGCTQKIRLSLEYEPLPTPTSIRLVKLHLLQDCADGIRERKYDIIECSIEVVDLEDGPDYFSLSYTWGDPRTIYTDKQDIFPAAHWAAPAFEIECDGKPVSVATNLYTALISLRSSFSANAFGEKLGPQYHPQNPSSLYIWIDALCINQDDLAEKSNQVPLMGRIYNQARATLMWLGGGELISTKGAIATAELCKNLVDRLKEDLDVDETSENYKQALSQRCRSFDITKAKDYEELGLEPIPPEFLIGWYMFVSRSWFKRAWVVQEWVMSRNCVFVCGAVAMNQGLFWDRISDFTQWNWLFQIQRLVRDNILDVETDGVPSWNVTPGTWHRAISKSVPDRWRDVPELFRAPHLKNDVAADWGGVLPTVQALREIMGYGRALKYPPPMREKFIQMARAALNLTVQDFRSTHATDPRDKVFAFYGLLTDQDGCPKYPTPDYAKTVTEVYTAAAQVMAQDLGTSFLAFAKYSHSNPHCLPSWAPDFSQEPGQLFMQDSPYFAAAVCLESTPIEFLENGRVMKVTGCCVDKVMHVQEEPLGAGVLVEGFRELMQLLSHIPEHSTILTLPKAILEDDEDANNSPIMPEITEQGRFEVLWRTLLQDHQMMTNDHPAPSWLGDIHRRRLRGFLLLQINSVYLRDLHGLLTGVLKEAKTCEDDFFTQFIEEMGGEDKGMLIHLEELLAGGAPLKRPYVREVEVDAIFEINAILSVLEGSLPFGSEDRPTPALWEKCQACWQDTWKAWEARDYENFKHYLFHGLEVLSSNDPTLDKARNVGGFVDNVSLFATALGRLGINPDGVEDGDEVWLIAGLHVPIVLRGLSQGQYRVIGCAYIHGIMHGEGLLTASTLQNICLV